MSLAPIVLFTYKRLDTLQQTIEALQKNYLAPDSNLYVFSDSAKGEHDVDAVTTVREFIKSINGFKSVFVIESQFNKGLATSVIEGVSQVLNEYEEVIVMEDDLLTTPNFLNFMNSALDYFKNNEAIYSINGYSHLIEGVALIDDGFYFHSRASSWGWATWGNRWEKNSFDKNLIREKINSDTSLLNNFNKVNGEDSGDMLLGSLNGKNDSWYIRWVFYNFLNNKLSVYPTLSKVINIGFNSDATNCDGISAYVSEVDMLNKVSFDFKNIVPLNKNDYRFLKYFSKKYKLIFRIKLLKTSLGRRKLIDELKSKLDL